MRGTLTFGQMCVLRQTRPLHGHLRHDRRLEQPAIQHEAAEVAGDLDGIVRPRHSHVIRRLVHHDIRSVLLGEHLVRCARARVDWRRGALRGESCWQSSLEVCRSRWGTSTAECISTHDLSRAMVN